MRVFLLIIAALAVCQGTSLRGYTPVVYNDATQYLPNRAADGLEAARNRFMQVMTNAQHGSRVAAHQPAGACSGIDQACDNEDDAKSDATRNSHLSGDMDETRDQELADALQTAKDQIVAKATQIKAEKTWVKEVTSLVTEYVHKIRKVNANIRTMQLEVKNLWRKKKQIENLILQRKLERKLRVANADLNTLKKALENLTAKTQTFVKSKKEIRETIGALEKEIAVLKGTSEGEDDKKKEK